MDTHLEGIEAQKISQLSLVASKNYALFICCFLKSCWVFLSLENVSDKLHICHYLFSKILLKTLLKRRYLKDVISMTLLKTPLSLVVMAIWKRSPYIINIDKCTTISICNWCGCAFIHRDIDIFESTYHTWLVRGFYIKLDWTSIENQHAIDNP